MNKNKPFVFLTIAVFLFLLLPSVFRDGMFMDGLIYAAISKNLANGIGTFWAPYFTQTFLPEFHEHPPLAFVLQSIFFEILGDAFNVEKLYSFFTAVAQAIIIILIWQAVIKEKENKNVTWLPVLLWITIPLCFWSYKNNMLENTMSVFTSASVLFQILAFNKERVKYGYVFLSGSFIFLGFLSKGFPSLFPLVFPVIHWLIIRKFSIYQYTFGIIGLISTLLIFAGVLFLNPDAVNSLSIYLNTQVAQSLQGERVVGERYYIIKKLFLELIPTIAFSLVFYLLTKRKALKIENYKWIWVFFLTGLSGSIPIVISPKQLGFYLVPSLPFFSLAFGIFLKKPLFFYIEKLPYKLFRKLNIGAGLLVLIALLFSFLQMGKVDRDEEKINDINIVGNVIGENRIISICPDMRSDYALHAYFALYYEISLDELNSHQYLLSDNTCRQNEVYNQKWQLKNYVLYERAKAK